MDDSESTDDDLHHQNGGLQYPGVNDRLENHLGSDRSHRQREIEPPFARNRSEYHSQSFEMESDSRPSVLNPSYQQRVHHRVRPSPQHLHQRQGEQLDAHRQSQDQSQSASAQYHIHPSINDRSAKNRDHCRGKARHSLHVDRDKYAKTKVSICHSNFSYQFKQMRLFID